MTEKMFRSCMGLLQKFWGELDLDLFKFYWSRFKSVPDEKFQAATSKILDSFKPTSSEKFPSPSRFVDLLEASEEDRINLAIGAVRKAASRLGIYKSVSFGDRALHEAIMRFGGWPEVAAWTDSEWKFREKAFISAYKAELNNNCGPSHLMGLSEEDYDNRKFDMKPEMQEKFKKSIQTNNFEWFGYKPLLENKSENIAQIAQDIGNLFDINR